MRFPKILWNNSGPFQPSCPGSWQFHWGFSTKTPRNRKKPRFLLKPWNMEIPWNPRGKVVVQFRLPNEYLVPTWTRSTWDDVSWMTLKFLMVYQWEQSLFGRSTWTSGIPPKKNLRSYVNNSLVSMKHHHHHHHHATKDTKIPSAGHCNFYLVFLNQKNQHVSFRLTEYPCNSKGRSSTILG